jgi:hypothetical protein
VLFVNGFPLVLVEAKTPVRPAVSWVDGAIQIHDDYERFVPELFVCNVFNVATEGKDLRYGAIHTPVELWSPWRPEEITSRRTAREAVSAHCTDDSQPGYRQRRGSAAESCRKGLRFIEKAIPSCCARK